MASLPVCLWTGGAEEEGCVWGPNSENPVISLLSLQLVLRKGGCCRTQIANSCLAISSMGSMGLKCHHPKLVHMEPPGPRAACTSASRTGELGEGRIILRIFFPPRTLFWQGKAQWKAVRAHQKVYWSIHVVLKAVTPSHLSRECTNATLHVSVPLQTDKLKYIPVLRDSCLWTQETLSPALCAVVKGSKLAQHSTTQTFPPAPTAGKIWGFDREPPSFRKLAATTIHNTAVSVQTAILWFRHTKEVTLFLETNSLRGVKRATNLSSLAVNHEEKQRRHFRGILSDCGETDWPTEYTNTAVHRTLKGWNWFFNCKL